MDHGTFKGLRQPKPAVSQPMKTTTMDLAICSGLAGTKPAVSKSFKTLASLRLQESHVSEITNKPTWCMPSTAAKFPAAAAESSSSFPHVSRGLDGLLALGIREGAESQGRQSGTCPDEHPLPRSAPTCYIRYCTLYHTCYHPASDFSLGASTFRHFLEPGSLLLHSLPPEHKAEWIPVQIKMCSQVDLAWLDVL